MSRRALNPEQHEWLEHNAAGRSRPELIELLRTTWGVVMTLKQINSYLKNHHIRTGVCTKFRPGHSGYAPPKGIRFSPETEFKSGHRPAGWKPVGSERVSKDGYVEVKVEEPRTWRLKHQVIWEQLHGPRPKGHAIIFVDGDRLNLSPDNLLLVSRHALLVLNQLGLMGKSAEINRSCVITAELIAEIERRQKDIRGKVPTRKNAGELEKVRSEADE